MKRKLFDDLVEGVKQVREIARGERATSRELYVDAAMIKQLRKTTKLRRNWLRSSQSKSAHYATGNKAEGTDRAYQRV
jgi:hypothetical protein